MGKRLFFTLFLACSLAAPAWAQQQTLSEMPGTAAEKSSQVLAPPQASQTQPTPPGNFLRGGAPINLTPGAYVYNYATQNTAVSPQNRAYLDALKPSSVARYNQSVARAAKGANSGASAIPSPFPPGMGFE